MPVDFLVRDSKEVDWNRRSREEPGRLGGGETVTRIYCAGKQLVSIKGKKSRKKFQYLCICECVCVTTINVKVIMNLKRKRISIGSEERKGEKDNLKT